MHSSRFLFNLFFLCIHTYFIKGALAGGGSGASTATSTTTTTAAAAPSATAVAVPNNAPIWVRIKTWSIW
jgi:hypothetical protein